MPLKPPRATRSLVALAFAAIVSGCVVGGPGENGGVPSGATHAETGLDTDFTFAPPITSIALPFKTAAEARSAYLNVTLDGPAVGAHIDGPGTCKGDVANSAGTSSTYSQFCGGLPAGAYNVTITVQAGAPSGHAKVELLVVGLLPGAGK